MKTLPDQVLLNPYDTWRMVHANGEPLAWAPTGPWWALIDGGDAVWLAGPAATVRTVAFVPSRKGSMKPHLAPGVRVRRMQDPAWVLRYVTACSHRCPRCNTPLQPGVEECGLPICRFLPVGRCSFWEQLGEVAMMLPVAESFVGSIWASHLPIAVVKAAAVDSARELDDGPDALADAHLRELAKVWDAVEAARAKQGREGYYCG